METIKKILVFIITLTCFLSNSKSQIVCTDVNPDSLINRTYDPDLNNGGIYYFTCNYSMQPGPLHPGERNHDPPGY